MSTNHPTLCPTGAAGYDGARPVGMVPQAGYPPRAGYPARAPAMAVPHGMLNRFLNWF
jgi:hypothetical protein